MYRGSTFTLVVDVFDEGDQSGENYIIPGEDIAVLRLSHAITDTPILLKEAATYDRAEGRLYFAFEPEDTEDLLTKGYDLTITLENSNGRITPVFQGRFGIVGINLGGE